jgi:predicted RNA methylase
VELIQADVLSSPLDFFRRGALESTSTYPFDTVIMNPPFGTRRAGERAHVFA